MAAIDAFRIAVILNMTSNHAAILGALSQHLFHVHGQVGQLTQGFSRLKMAIGGALGATVGIGMIDTMVKLTKATADYSAELVSLKRLGPEVAAAVNSGAMEKLAFDVSRVVPVSPLDVLKAVGVGRSIFGTEPSMALAETFAKAQFVLGQHGGRGGADPSKELNELLRAGQISGRLNEFSKEADPALTQHWLDQAIKIISATHGLVTSHTLLGMAQQQGALSRGLTDQGMLSQAIVAQSMGGPRTGTAFLSTLNQLAGGQMNQRVAAGMEKYGLIQPGEYQRRSGFGGILSDVAKKRLSGQFGSDPLDFIAGLVGQLEAHGVKDPTAIGGAITEMFGRQTSQRYTAEMVMELKQMLAERGRINEGMGLGAAGSLMMNEDVKANLTAVAKAWERFNLAIAGPLIGPTISALDSIHGVFLSMGDFARENPDLVRGLAVAFTALGAALTVLGSAALVGALMSMAGPAGLILALAAALGVLAGVNWKAISSGLGLVASQVPPGSRADSTLAMLASRDPYPLGGPPTAPNEREYGSLRDRQHWAQIAAWKQDVLSVLATLDGFEAAVQGFGKSMQTWSSNLFANVTKAFSDFYGLMSGKILALPGELIGAINTAFSGMRDAIARALHLGGSGSGSTSSPISPRDWGVPRIPHGLLPSVPQNWLRDFGHRSSLGPPGPGGPGGLASGAANAISTARGGTTINVVSRLDINGRVLADSLSSLMADLLASPMQAPGWNEHGGHFPVDQYST